MDIITENDSIILDSILTILQSNNKFTTSDLKHIYGYENRNPLSDYDFYFEIIDSYRLVTGNRSASNVNLIPIKIRLDNFIENGGFKIVYNDSIREKRRNEEIDRLSLSKLKNETWL